MDLGLLAIILLLCGLLLFVLEVFLPSGGLISAAAILSVVGALWSAWRQWHDGNPSLWWSFTAATVVLIPAVLVASFWILPKTRFGRQILLEAPNEEEVTPFTHEQQHLHDLMGYTGVTLSMLNPGGMILVAGERHHCESEGGIIDRDCPVQIVGQRSNCLIVRKSDSGEAQATPPPDSDGWQLDFEPLQE